MRVRGCVQPPQCQQQPVAAMILANVARAVGISPETIPMYVELSNL